MALNFKYKLSKEMQNKAYEIVEVARKTGKIKRGTNEITKAIERGTAKLVIIAEDVNPIEVIMHIPILCEEKNIPCLPVPGKEELGAAAGLQVGTASIAVITEGDSKSLIEDIVKKIEKA